MRKIVSFIAIFASLAILVSCGNRAKKTTEEIRFHELTEQYVQEELQLSHFDSVRVVKVDTVDNYEYAQIMVDILLMMNEETMDEYTAALMAEDEAVSKDLEIKVDEIASAGHQWEMEVEATANAPKTTRYYLVTANYYAGQDIDQFYFFVTTDFKIHIPDPFAEL